MSLTRRQREVLEIIRRFIGERSYPPTCEELAALMGVKAKSSAHRVIEILVEEGYLEKDALKARAIRLISRSA